MSESEMEYLPITVEQAAKLVFDSMSEDEVRLIKNMTTEDFELFNFFQDYSIIEKFGLEDGNLALLENCTNLKNEQNNLDSSVFLVSPEEASEIILKKTVEIILREKFIQDSI